MASYYFEDVQSTLLEDEATLTKTRTADPTPPRPSPKGQADSELLRERVVALEQANQELQRKND